MNNIIYENIKKFILKPCLYPLKKVTNYLIKDSISELNKKINLTAKEIKYNRKILSAFYNLYVDREFSHNLVSYDSNEKVRVVFYYQVASFWPSWESLYNECVNDEQFDVKLVLLNETVNEKTQMITAEQFLIEHDLKYVDSIYFDVDSFNPHIIIYQTPYDNGHRKPIHQTAYAKAKGFRVVYIPYGIEITDTETSRKAHFEQDVIKNNWRLYTFSERMKLDYQYFSVGRYGVRALGLPRFDCLYYKEKFLLNEAVMEKKLNRKLVLWKVHFPKIINEGGKKFLTTPYLTEYEKFSQLINNQSDLYFIFMPHPKFEEEHNDDEMNSCIQNIMNNLALCENVYIDRNDDYRSSLVNADYIMVDRSAIMVEAGALNVPVLYLSNEDYTEPVTNAIEPLIDSYYHGHTAKDMLHFLNCCKNNIDPKKEERQKAFAMCIPYFDGKCGERIKNDLLVSLKNEKEALPHKINNLQFMEEEDTIG